MDDTDLQYLPVKVSQSLVPIVFRQPKILSLDFQSYPGCVSELLVAWL